jgi:hypothetical protein
MSTWRQKRELEELKKRDKAAYDKVIAARQNALGALGKFDDNLQELRKHLQENPVCISVDDFVTSPPLTETETKCPIRLIASTFSDYTCFMN